MRITILLISITILICSCQSNKQKAIIHYRNSQIFLNAKDIANALKEIEVATKLDSANYDFTILKAKIKIDENLLEESTNILKSLINKKFKQDTVYFLIGDNYFQLGNYFSFQKQDDQKANEAYKNSVEFYDKAIKTNSQYFDAHFQKQKALFNIEKYDEAIITINNGLNIFPNNKILIFSRGVSKNELGDKIGAIIDLNDAIQSKKLDSLNLSTAYRFRGIIYSQMDSLKMSLLDFTQAIEFNPKSNLAYASRGDTYRLLKNKEKACKDYRKAADLGLITVYETIKEYCNGK